MSSGPELPSGTVTFLFTDIEGSTRLLKQLRDGYANVLAEHQKLLRAAFVEHGGQVVDTQGDSFFVAFRRAKDAVSAAVAGQQALVAHSWPDGVGVGVRMGIHTGQAEATGGRYHGLAVHRASRIGDSAHGGQVLVSQTTRELLEDEEEESQGIVLRDLGEQRLKDLDRPVRLYQLEADGLPSEFPPLRTMTLEPEVAQDVEAGVDWRRRLRLMAPLAAVVVGGAIAAGVLLSRGSSGSAQASAGVAADSVGVFNAKNGTLIAQAPVRTGPGAVAVGEGAIWVVNVNDDSVSRIDAKTNQSVQTIPVGRGPAGIAIGGSFLWVANSLDGTVSKIDPRQNNGKVVEHFQVGNQPTGIAYGEGGVWVANSADRTVVRIDPRSGVVGRPIAVDAGADAIAVGAGSLWVASESAGSVSRMDPRSGSVQPINIGNGAAAVAVGAGSVWVANGSDDTVSRIDPTSNRVQATIPVGAGPSGISVNQDGVWVSNELGGTLSRIDPARNTVVKTVETGNRPGGVALTGDTLYVTVRTTGLIHHGGTLTVVSGSTFGAKADFIDPARAYNTFSWSLLMVTNDGLVTYKRVGGGEGTRLVPDLATSLPTPTNGGKNFTFRIRPEIRYSTGALVRPADFRRAIERSLGDPAGVGQNFFTGIVGAEACVKTPKRCDLAKGIMADLASNTVTFRLTAPDPDFLYKLALPTADAVPAATPIKARLPLPATGPYMIASYDAKQGKPRAAVRLVRNPRFHEWSAAAQPNGYPDEILEKFGYSDEARLRAVERKTADLTDVSGVSPARLSVLRTQYASQLHEHPSLETSYFALNTRVPPFNDLRVRQAVNYGIDRKRLAKLTGSADVNQPSCQVLPPNLAGYHRYCPYTIDRRSDERYTGPDLKKAKELVAVSGTTGQAVTVWTWKTFGPRGGAYFVSVLRSLGYKAQLKVVQDGQTYFAAVADSRRKIQAALIGWFADYASASDFFGPLLTCRSFEPRTSNNVNYAEFCSRPIDAEIAHASALQTSDRQAAAVLWSKIDRDVVDQAPWVAFSNQQAREFISSRVGNYTYYLWIGGALLDQLWVR